MMCPTLQIHITYYHVTGMMILHCSLTAGINHKISTVKNDLSRYEKDEVFTELFVAFSRDQVCVRACVCVCMGVCMCAYVCDGCLIHITYNQRRYTYIHHHMKENSEHLFNLLHKEKGYLYVCGLLWMHKY